MKTSNTWLEPIIVLSIGAVLSLGVWSHSQEANKDNAEIQALFDTELRQSQEAAFFAGKIAAGCEFSPKTCIETLRNHNLKLSDYKDFNSWRKTVIPQGYLTRMKQIEDHEK
jgi:hypothetical protein